ncbi:MAG: hypothetical protein IJE81_02800 [Oscillospiraceae bacterium]|nr:hypothetical protein [Oscillospiraceae bacterium]
MQKKLVRCLYVVVTVLAAAGLLWSGFRVLEQDYVFWGGSLFSRHTQNLDISGRKMRHPEAFLRFTDLRCLDARQTGMTPEQYEWFRQEIPGCRVLWDVPIQGTYYSQDTQALRVEQLTDADAENLKYLPALELLDVGSWDDYARIQTLRERYPELTVRYRVEIAGEWWDSDVVSMILENADAGELMEKLALFDRLESILLTGSVPQRQALQQLQDRYPHVFFLWKMDALGMTLETDITELDLTAVRLDSVEELRKLLPYFPKLEQVHLESSGLSQTELVALVREYPEVRFRFDLTFAGHTFSTDVREIDISNTPMTGTRELEALLPCFYDLEKVVMCECGLDSETMDALNRRYEDIRFVWSVNLAGMLFRTDAVHFTPNRWGLCLRNETIYDLRYCTDMVCVDIGHNMMVTNCDWVRYMPNLKYLVLAETGISDLTPLENHENLVFLEIFLSRVTDYSPLLTCRALEDLNLCYTKGDPEPLAEMTWLKRLWWTGSWAGRTYLADKLPDTYKEFLSTSSTGRGWREGQHYYDMRDFIGMEYMVG